MLVFFLISLVWEKDAAYQYYKHGPLARVVLGQQAVQGIDYAYTLQGWLKGVNATAVGDGAHSFPSGSPPSVPLTPVPAPVYRQAGTPQTKPGGEISSAKR